MMPWRCKRACRTCGLAFDGPSCPTCTRKRQQDVDARRGTAEERGYGERWRVESREWLRDPEHPERAFCADPFKLHRVRHVSEMVDHIVPHKGDPVLFWDRSNWQPICRRCNSIKCARLEGGFNNPIKPTVSR